MNIDPKKMAEDKEELSRVVGFFSRDFANLEDDLAALLDKVIFPDGDGSSRIAYAIYFSLDGFGQRQGLVNSAITEWFAENEMGGYDFAGMWDCINHRLGTIKSTRNLVAHGSVRSVIIRDALHVRLIPPTFHTETVKRVMKGTLPGKSLDEMTHALSLVNAVRACLHDMMFAIQDHDLGEPTWRQRFDGLVERRNRLNSLFPADQIPKACKDQPQPSQE